MTCCALPTDICLSLPVHLLPVLALPHKDEDVFATVDTPDGPVVRDSGVPCSAREPAPTASRAQWCVRAPVVRWMSKTKVCEHFAFPCFVPLIPLKRGGVPKIGYETKQPSHKKKKMSVLALQCQITQKTTLSRCRWLAGFWMQCLKCERSC